MGVAVGLVTLAIWGGSVGLEEEGGGSGKVVVGEVERQEVVGSEVSSEGDKGLEGWIVVEGVKVLAEGESEVLVAGEGESSEVSLEAGGVG